MTVFNKRLTTVEATMKHECAVYPPEQRLAREILCNETPR
jgi:hypothetical protein